MLEALVWLANSEMSDILLEANGSDGANSLD